MLSMKKKAQKMDSVAAFATRGGVSEECETLCYTHECSCGSMSLFNSSYMKGSDPGFSAGMDIAG